ncbi:hypothetical protein CapIbe_010987 [Capra ibex]
MSFYQDIIGSSLSPHNSACNKAYSSSFPTHHPKVVDLLVDLAIFPHGVNPQSYCCSSIHQKTPELLRIWERALFSVSTTSWDLLRQEESMRNSETAGESLLESAFRQQTVLWAAHLLILASLSPARVSQNRHINMHVYDQS